MVSMQLAALVVALSGVGETVLLDFSAPWCAPCRSMEGTIAELQQAGYPVRKVNVDHERALAAQYNVSSIPCFVMLADGKEVGRTLGAVRRTELLDLFAKAGAGPGAPSNQIARAQSPDPPKRILSLPKRPARNPLTPPARGRAPAEFDADATGQTAAAGGLNSPQDLIPVCVRLTVADATGSSYGSGTIIDSRQGEALILTCGHIFRESQGKGRISVDLCSPDAPQKLAGRMVAYDLKCDLGLVSIRPGVPVSVAPVAPKGYRVAKGDKVITVGCNNGGPATALESNITAIDKFLGSPNFQVAGLPVQGRSGGGLFTADGQVIGVCNAADPADNEGLFAALTAIQGQLDSAGLAMVYEEHPLKSRPALATTGAPPMPARMPQHRVAASVPTGDQPSAAAGADTAGLTESERAALAEVQRRGESAEVICIVRSLSDPRAKSEVIVLDRASPEFLRQLASDREVQDARHLTTLEVRSPRPQQRALAR